MTETFIDTDADSIVTQLAAFPGDQPIVMLNLMRFAEQANFDAEHDIQPCSGFESYIHYGTAVGPMIEAAGGEILWQGRQAAMLIGPSDKNWELVVLVRYPSARAFIDMINSAAYQAVAHYRNAALIDSRLIAHQQL